MHNRILSRSSILTGTCGVLIIILPFLCYLYRNAFSDYVPIFVSSMSICLILIVHAANSHIGSRIRITVLDLLVAAYLTWGVFNLWLIRPDWPSLRFWSEWIFLVCTYLAARLFFTDRQKVLAGFIVISGVAQSLWGIMQAIRVLPPGHEYFAATGAFPNPGPWGGYVSISLISCIMTIIDAKKGKMHKFFYTRSLASYVSHYFSQILGLRGSLRLPFFFICHGIVYDSGSRFRTNTGLS